MKTLPSIIVLCAHILFSSCGTGVKRDTDFGAYYTKIITGEDFERFSRTGEYTDIIVDMGADFGQLIFWQGANFLPYWKAVKGDSTFFEEIVPRSGDGVLEMMPDRVNTYSHAKIIESSDEEVIVHWRYLRSFEAGNPHPGVSPDGFVDEYFRISPKGEIHRSIRAGQKKSDEWNDPGNIVSQTILLTKKGFRSSEIIHEQSTVDPAGIKGADLLESTEEVALVRFDFNEGVGEKTAEKGTDMAIEVTGRKVLWRTGVSGTCLQFDGYHTEVRLPQAAPLDIRNEISLQAFVALGAYPWSWCPIVQQCDDEPEMVTSSRENGRYIVRLEKEHEQGFFLGINGDGFPGFKLRVGDTWEELVGDFHLERRSWYLVTATFSSQSGEMKIYVNQELVGKKGVKGGEIGLSPKDILIGRGKPRRPINPVRANTFPGQFAFDGLIDEVRIFNTELSSDQISTRFTDAQTIMNAEVAMDRRVLPAGPEANKFGAYYDHLNFYDIWDNLWCFSDHPDVVVGFEKNPSKFVFWRGVSYIPMMVNEKGQWFSNEFNETWGTSGGDGCQEPMSDKGNYFTYARILENTPARVVVHYRFPLADVNLVKANYETENGWYDVADWYYYIYPDGVASKRMHLWTSGNRNHEWQESMAIFGPDQHPEDIIEKENTVTMLNMDEDQHQYNWTSAPPPNVAEPKNQCIQVVNYTGEYDPVTIGEEFEGSNVYGGELTPYSVFPTWNHWPVAQMPSDGRYASYPDRTGHSSLTHVYLPVYAESEGDQPFYEKILLEGMLKTSEVDLVSLARSWNQAPEIELLSTGRAFYDKAQRAYIIEDVPGDLQLSLKASVDHPIHNCCLEVKNWGKIEVSQLTVDGEAVDFRQGIVRDTDGRYQLIIWLEIYRTEDILVEVLR